MNGAFVDCFINAPSIGKAMDEPARNTWLFKPGTNGEIEKDFIEGSIVGVEIHMGNNFSYFDDLKDLKRHVEKNIPVMKNRPEEITLAFNISATMKIDDYVLLPSVADPHIVNLGKVVGDYVFRPYTKYPLSREVVWYCKIGRDRLSRKMKNSFNTNRSMTSIKGTDLLEDLLANRRLIGM